MAKYHGPCLNCGKMSNEQYSRKLCRRCYRGFQESDKFIPRKKYLGPCVICGTLKSPGGHFVRKMCRACHSRMTTSGNQKPREKYPGPCIVCGNLSPAPAKHFLKKMCRSCYRKARYAEKHPKKQKQTFCIECEEEAKKIIKGRCRSCHRKYRQAADPELVKRERERINKYRSSEKGRETSRRHVRKRRAQLAQVENTLTKEEWESVLDTYNHRCVYCGSKDSIEMDHIIPVSKGGPHSIENVVPSCRHCNNKKNVGLPPKPVQPILI